MASGEVNHPGEPRPKNDERSNARQDPGCDADQPPSLPGRIRSQSTPTQAETINDIAWWLQAIVTWGSR